VGYIREDAKRDAKMQSLEQIGAVQQKVKKWADKIQVGGFYKKAEAARKEGEVWEEDGKKWTVRGGIKQSISNLERARLPHWCPKCGKNMNGKLNEKFYWLKGTCHDCWSSYETKMRLAGVYGAYERRMLRANERSWIADVIAQHLDYIENQNDMEIHFMDGRWEVLAKASEFDEVKEKLQKDIQFMYDRLSVIEEEEIKDVENYKNLEAWQAEHPWAG
jgi:hypothetical protein